MKRALLTLSAGLALCLTASAAIVAQWNFNAGNYLPASGTGLASLVGNVTNPGFLTAGSPSDPLGSDAANLCLKLAPFPGSTAGNKTTGAQYAVDTTGYQNITLAWDHLDSAQGSKYWRVLYSIDNGVTWVEKDVIVNNGSGGAWMNPPPPTVSFQAVPGANNNPNFLVRLLSEFQDSATGSGFHGYVALNGTSASYTTAGTLKMDMVTFSGTTYSPNVTITTDPVSQVVGIGQAASFSVAAIGGSTPYTYQWRKNSSPQANATNSLYAIAAAQPADAGSYDVIVANGVSSQTSAVATLSVSNPQGIAWSGLNGTNWDTATVSWLNTNSLANVAYSGGDFVLFDSRGVAAPSISLAASLSPGSLTVNADFDYLLRSDVGGKIDGATGLTKRGTGTLTLDTDNTYSGATLIQAGALQLGAMDAHGSTGTGPITNNGALLFNRTDIITLTNPISGSGSLTNLGGDVTLTSVGGTVTLAGPNSFNGPIAVRKGALILSGNQTVNSTNIIVSPSAATGPGGATKFGLSGGMVIGSGTTVYLPMLLAGDSRCALVSTFGTNSFNGPIVAEGSGSIALQSDGVGTLLNINGNVSGPSYAGAAFLRGTGAGVLNGTINLPTSFVHKTDDSTWTINSSGNSWFFTTFAMGTLRLGTNNALPTALTMEMGVSGKTATLDLGGFSQQLAVLRDAAAFGPQFIGSRSVTSDSTLSVGSGFFSGTIQDKIGSAGTRKTSLIVNGGTFTLAGFNTYSGDTTVLAGTLALSGVGDIANSPVINLAGGALDVSARPDQTLLVYANQTLKGNGTLAITGSLVNNGTIELKLSKSGAVVSNDKLAVSGQVLYGGTLRLLLSGQSLTLLDTIPIATAGGGFVESAFGAIEPAAPAPGLAWDTSTLAIDGILRITGTGLPMFTGAALSASGNALIFNGGGGVTNGTFTVLASTNVAAPLASWVTLQSGSFDGNANFRITNAILPGMPKRFFSLQVP